MEVHPPEHPIHTWRDFFIHIVTIVIGLLIAIGLEQSVEWFHHRHIVHTARENISREIDDNRKLAASNGALAERTKQLMLQNMHRVQQLKHNPHALDHGEMHFTFGWSAFSDTAWLSARDTGALAFMPVEEVQRDAGIYTQQTIVNDQAISLFLSEALAASPLLMTEDKAVMTSEDQHELLKDTAQLYLRLQTLQQIMQGLNQDFADVDKH